MRQGLRRIIDIPYSGVRAAGCRGRSSRPVTRYVPPLHNTATLAGCPVVSACERPIKGVNDEEEACRHRCTSRGPASIRRPHPQDRPLACRGVLGSTHRIPTSIVRIGSSRASVDRSTAGTALHVGGRRFCRRRRPSGATRGDDFETDRGIRRQVVALYDQFVRLDRSPIVAINRPTRSVADPGRAARSRHSPRRQAPVPGGS